MKYKFLIAPMNYVRAWKNGWPALFPLKCLNDLADARVRAVAAKYFLVAEEGRKVQGKDEINNEYTTLNGKI